MYSVLVAAINGSSRLTRIRCSEVLLARDGGRGIALLQLLLRVPSLQYVSYHKRYLSATRNDKASAHCGVMRNRLKAALLLFPWSASADSINTTGYR